ncbi:MAG TPA: hypothetical protein VK631_15275 [Solirubrobacteraceae bacterium]|nr:hypothetical protein [Solirubrobacteraceae bacterium]
MPPTPTGHFASLRSELIVVERPAVPQYAGARVVGTQPGLYHQFREHRCLVKGQKSIDYLRERMKAPDAPGIWELEASDVPEVTALLAELALADADRVRDVLDEERKTANRAVIVDTCERVLQRMGVSERKPGQKVVAA